MEEPIVRIPIKIPRGRLRYPALNEEEQKKIDNHKSRGIRPKKPNSSIVHAGERVALKKILAGRGETLVDPSDVERNKKISNFVNEFIKNGGNATNAATLAFGIEDRQQAANLGSKLLKEVKGIANLYLDTKGASYGKLIETAIEKMEESKTPEWWDRLMKMAGHEDFISKDKGSPVAINIMNSQKDFLRGYVEEGELADEE